MPKPGIVRPRASPPALGLTLGRVLARARALALALAPALGLALPLAVPPPAHGQQVRLAFLFSDGNTPGTLAAFKALLEERPDLRGRVSLQFLTESVFDRVEPGEITGADVLVLDIMNEQMLERFHAAHGVDLIGAVGERGVVLAVGEGLLPQEHYAERGAVWDERARAFWAGSGPHNQLGLLKLAASYGGVTELEIPDPQPALDAGYYYPDGGAGRVFASWEEFDAWREANGKLRPGAPRVAVGFYRATYYGGDTELLDAVIAEIERHGAEAIPVFGYPGALAYRHLLLDDDGLARADVSLAFLFRFADFEATKHLEELDIPVLSLISLYGRGEAEWRSSTSGLSMLEGTFQVATPELAGLIAPTVVGSQEQVTDPETGVTVVVRRPIASRVTLAVQRALRYAALRDTPNGEKRVALMFYNYPPGKAGIGASYLNVAESLANVLARLEAEGYDLGGADVSTDRVLADITTRARNVGGYAPGELADLLEAGGAVRVHVGVYRRWLDELAPPLRAKVLEDWGAPEEATLMAAGAPGERYLVIPVVRYGNAVLLPQPARGWGEDHEKLYHARDLAPHHQYVAAYAWLRHEFGADAVVHVGTHGTHEWLDGKDMGLSEEDASDALIADLPNLYIYNVDVVAEGLVARRRGMATLVDHMTPPFVPGGLYPELARLSETINDFDAALHRSPELARAYAQDVRRQIVELGIDRDLGIDLVAADSLTDGVVHRIMDYMIELRSQNIPYGLHAFGRTPEPEPRSSTVEAIVATDRSLLPHDVEVLADEMERRILASGPRELDRLVRALAGGYVATGVGGEPIRNPDVYPTGKNFYGIDPDKIPKPAAWRLGVELADRMLADHVERHGDYPRKVSFVIWGDETMRHEGVLESQIFHLLGTRPVWDARGNVVDVELVPAAELGRPRIDIVIASASQGMFANLTMMMDRAVQVVKMVEEAENHVRRHYLETRAALIEMGYSEEDADRRAGVRIFDEPPGIFNLNTSGIVAASGTWDSDRPIADEYLAKMGHGYGNGFWGEPMEDVFRLALAGTEKVVHSSSTMLYGALDNDDMFMYMGGLAAAVRSIDGASPELVVTNTRDPGNPQMTSIDRFIGTEFRSRYVNPTWIEGMQAEGYAGANAMREFVEYLWGWDATVPEVIDDAMWQETFAVYVQDRYDMGMQAFFDEHSPFAYQDITARMIETIRKGYWDADAATEATLIGEYLASVDRHGLGCSEHTCGNPRFSAYVVEEALAAGIAAADVERFRDAMEYAMGIDIAGAALALEDFVRRNEAPDPAPPIAEPVPAPAPVALEPVSAPPAAAEPDAVPAVGAEVAPEPAEAPDAAPNEFVEGYRMVPAPQPGQTVRGGSRAAGAPGWAGLWFGLPILGLLLVWRWHRAHRRRTRREST